LFKLAFSIGVCAGMFFLNAESFVQQTGFLNRGANPTVVCKNYNASSVKITTQLVTQ
jgi:hypothetical protein